MLLRFSVANYRSFRDEVIFNMVPAKSRTMKDHVIKNDHGKRTEVLPLAMIYGANASGKTNFIKAISFMRKKVLLGTKAGDLTGTVPFKLDPDYENKPSRFEIVFKHNDILYTYGFVMSSDMILEEWLFAYLKNREMKIFERKTEDENAIVESGTVLEKNVKDKNFIKYVSQGTRKEQLFLTEAREKNIALIKPVIEWFSEYLYIIRPNDIYVSLALRAHEENSFGEFLGNLLRKADTRIRRIKCEEEEFNPDKHLIDLSSEDKRRILDDLKIDKPVYGLIRTPSDIVTISKEKGFHTAKYIKLKTVHENSEGKEVDFNIKQESDGTQRLMDLAPMLFDLWSKDKVYIIDELDRSLHTQLSRMFIEIILAGKDKKERGQVILTTHDTNLLDRSLLRRDEIWFMEKDDNESTHLTSLAEYSVTEGLNYENGYLNGRFGAIPDIHNPEELIK